MTADKKENEKKIENEKSNYSKVDTNSKSSDGKGKLTLKLKKPSSDSAGSSTSNTSSTSSSTASASNSTGSSSSGAETGSRRSVTVISPNRPTGRPQRSGGFGGPGSRSFGDDREKRAHAARALSGGRPTSTAFASRDKPGGFGGGRFGGGVGGKPGAGRFGGRGAFVPPPTLPTEARGPGKTFKKRKDQYDNGARTRSPDGEDEDNLDLNVGIGVVQDAQGLEIDTHEKGWRKSRQGGNRFGHYANVQSKEVEIYDDIEIKDIALAAAMNVKHVLYVLRKQLSVKKGHQDSLDIDTAELLVTELGHIPKVMKLIDVDSDPVPDFEGELKHRAPVVTIVGHVDHGKTSLLDALRQTSVVAGEAGGITQHIGAYQVKSSKGEIITFLDTPGHETFTAMRARGVSLTDIAILVVAGDDSVQDQTIEAIRHIQASKVPMILAITKMDKVQSDATKVKHMLLTYGVITEDMSGDVIAVEVSAHTGKGLKELLDAISLQAEVMELKAREEGHAIGVVLETLMKKGFGIVTNIIVQKGTLKVGDSFVAGKTAGKVRVLKNTEDSQVKIAGPSEPISIIGASEFALPGDRLVVVPSDKVARDTVQARINKEKNAPKQVKTLEELYSMDENDRKSLNMVLKADTNGSVEALQAGIESIENAEVDVKVIYAGAGPVTESDILLAHTSNALLISFHNKLSSSLIQLAKERSVKVISENVIYRIFEQVDMLLKGMQEPVFKDVVLGKAEVIKLFEFSKGTIAGSRVIDGKIVRNMKIKVLRGSGDQEKKEIFKGAIRSMQREMNDLKEAGKGYEIGLMLEGFNDFKLGDILECYETVQENIV